MSKNVKLTLDGETKNYTGISTVQIPTTDGGTAEFKDVDEIPVPSGDKTITANGTYDVSAFAQAVVNVPTGGSNPVLQTKNVTITENGTTQVLPDTGNDGMSAVNVTVNVPVSGGESVGLPDITLISTNTYTHDEDWLTDDVGMASHFVKKYCNAEDTTDEHLYICEIAGNTAPNYKGISLLAWRITGGTSVNRLLCRSVRDTASNRVWNAFTDVDDPESNGAYCDGGTQINKRSFYVSAGSTVTVNKYRVDWM